MSSSDPGPLPQTIRDQAAAWVIRQERGFTPTEEAEFASWLAADPRHRACFEEQIQNWSVLDRLRELGPPQSSKPDLDWLAPRKKRKWPGVAALALAASVALLWVLRDPPVSAVDHVSHHVEERTLDDGSLILLNRDTRLRVAFRPEERSIELSEGEAFFSVKPDPGRPFVVRAGGVRVDAIGTAFDVKISRDEIQVLVTEGRVSLLPSESILPGRENEATPLAAGEAAAVDLRDRRRVARVRKVDKSEIDRWLGWQPGTLEFVGATLAEVTAAFNAKNSLRLEIADPSLDSLRLTLSFRSNNVEGFVRMLEEAFGVEAVRRENTIQLRRRH